MSQKNNSTPLQDDDATRLDTRASAGKPVSAPAPAERSASENCLATGTMLADFEITGVVGEGGFGIVYHAFDHTLRRTVAIKEYMPVAMAGRGPDNTVAVRSAKHNEAFSAGLESYINEARMLAQFDHPSLVKVYRFWEQNNTAYMAMQYYDGITLKQVIETQSGLVNEAWLTNILKGVLAALQTLYGMHVLHRDISPENIMVQNSGVPVLLDFGSARQVISGMPQDLTVILKASFAPVEQYADDSHMVQGAWTDIYALCAVVYNLITGVAPPRSVARMIKDPMVWLTAEKYPDYSAHFLAAINKGLQVLPPDRPQTLADFCNLLHIPVPSLPQTAGPAVRISAPDNKAMGQISQPGSKNTPSGKPDVSADRSVNESVNKSASKSANKSPEKPRSRSKKSSKVEQKGWKWRWDHTFATGVLMTAVGAILFFARPNKVHQDSANASASAPMSAPVAASLTASVTAPPAPGGSEVSAPPAPETVATASQTPAEPANTTNVADKPAAAVAPAAKSPATPAPVPSATPVPPAATLAANESLVTDKNATASPDTPPMGVVALSIKPWGTLYIDGEQKGVSPPMKRLQLPPGKYKVKIVNPAFPDYQTEIQVTAKRPARVSVDFSGQDNTNPQQGR